MFLASVAENGSSIEDLLLLLFSTRYFQLHTRQAKAVLDCVALDSSNPSTLSLGETAMPSKLGTEWSSDAAAGDAALHPERFREFGTLPVAASEFKPGGGERYTAEMGPASASQSAGGGGKGSSGGKNKSGGRRGKPRK